jgi:hypothetical protein
MAEQENSIKQKEYLLEKIYDKYKMEISRKARLESKAIGYYTVTGISFAAFLIIEPLLFSGGYLILFSAKEVFSILNYIFLFTYIVVFIVSIIRLHNSYKPKLREEFDPIENWELLLTQDETGFIESIKKNLTVVIKDYLEMNERTYKSLKLVNLLCLLNMFLVVAILIVLIISYCFKL